jgi:hypothetical protein
VKKMPGGFVLVVALSSPALLLPGTTLGRRGVEREGHAVVDRRHLLLRAAAACSGAFTLGRSPTPAHAEYGEAASMRAPALLPSPFYPTGAMADTCIQVAIGREDVCLVPKKPISSYESMQLDRWADELAAPRSSIGRPAGKIVESTAHMIEMVRKNDFTGIERELANLQANLADLGGGDAKAIQACVDTLAKEFKRPRPELEAGRFAPIIMKLSAAVSDFADSGGS